LYDQNTESVVPLDDNMPGMVCYDMDMSGTKAVRVANASTNPGASLNVIVMLGIDKYLGN